ncbi:MAG: Mov34/MPN/PAD-1 family protein, partial [Anaerolineales bacterium]|nr:Mov34/MPN/PAD-1 family protein [Anaerolineales bacterium]
PIQNLQHSSTAFLMNPVQQVRAWYALHRAGQTLLAIYHSHPHTAAWPSAQDQADLSFPEVLQVIVSLREYDQPQVRAFWLAPAVQEVTIRLENASK